MSDILEKKLVAISLSTSEDLLERGFTSDDLNDVLLFLGRDLMRRGARIAYGGILGVGQDFTETLTQMANYETSEGLAPFVNYQPWPWCLKITKRLQAEKDGIIDYVCVGDQPELTDPTGDQSVDARRSSKASSRMRNWMAEKTGARVLIGGATQGFAGLMPGVLEEALYHWQKRKPVYVVGGFGGAANVVAQALLGSSPPPQNVGGGRYDFDDLIEGYATDASQALEYDVLRQEAEKCYERLTEEIQRVRDSGLENGLNEDDNTTLMKTTNPDEISRLVMRGLENVTWPAEHA